MLLAVDAGNSFVKLAYHDGQRWGAVERIPVDGFAARAAAWNGPAPDAVVVSDVAGPAFRAALEALVGRWRCPLLWVAARERACGVINTYRNPAQLGSDRWCALVAARRLGGGAKLVCAVGTAATLDALSAEGVFEGGLILPGIELMKRALTQHTAGVVKTDGAFEMFPRDTGSGVHTGALLAIAGAAERAAEVLAARHGKLEVLLTGGASSLLAPVMRPAPRLVPDLVLEGLLCIAQEEGIA